MSSAADADHSVRLLVIDSSSSYVRDAGKSTAAKLRSHRWTLVGTCIFACLKLVFLLWPFVHNCILCKLLFEHTYIEGTAVFAGARRQPVAVYFRPAALTPTQASELLDSRLTIQTVDEYQTTTCQDGRQLKKLSLVSQRTWVSNGAPFPFGFFAESVADVAGKAAMAAVLLVQLILSVGMWVIDSNMVWHGRLAERQLISDGDRPMTDPEQKEQTVRSGVQILQTMAAPLLPFACIAMLMPVTGTNLAAVPFCLEEPSSSPFSMYGVGCLSTACTTFCVLVVPLWRWASTGCVPAPNCFQVARVMALLGGIAYTIAVGMVLACFQTTEYGLVLVANAAAWVGYCLTLPGTDVCAACTRQHTFQPN
jgi:hypothetical protein